MDFKLQAKKRGSQKADDVRKTGMMPAILYGTGRSESSSIMVDGRAMEKVYHEAGESNLIELILDDGTSVNVIIKDIQYHPTKNMIVHIDFMEIQAGVEMEAVIPLSFVGESPAQKQGGVLATAIEEVSVTCLPKDLPSTIEVDISILKTVDDNIHIKDIKLPAGVAITEPVDSLVVRVNDVEIKSEESKQNETNDTTLPDGSEQSTNKAKENSSEKITEEKK